MELRGRVLLAGLLVAAAVGTPVATAQAGTLGVSTRLATPAFPSAVSAASGVIAWAAASGHGHRFEIVIRQHGRDRSLRATSAVGWIDAVKLGTGGSGRAIVVYSRCPHSPFATGSAGSAGTDGCRLWWARIAGGAAHRILAAPANTSVGVATRGVVVFAVQHSTAHEHQPARIERAGLGGGSAHALALPTPDGATIEDISADGEQVAFTRTRAREPRTRVSRSSGSTPAPQRPS